MALTDNPYLPLYVKDWQSSNKLKMCSMAAHGLLINIICILHRENTYGRILLEQKFKQTPDTCLNFASQLACLLPFSRDEIAPVLAELVAAERLKIDGDYLFSEKMEKLNNLSNIRAAAGKKGGKASTERRKKAVEKDNKPRKNFAQAKSKANPATVTVNEIDNKGAKSEKLIFPYDTPKFLQAWEAWKKYKAEQHGFKYKSASTEQAALTELAKVSSDDIEAVEVIMQSIGNGWKGFFKLKKETHGSSKDRARAAAEYALRNRGYID